MRQYCKIDSENHNMPILKYNMHVKLQKYWQYFKVDSLQSK